MGSCNALTLTSELTRSLQQEIKKDWWSLGLPHGFMVWALEHIPAFARQLFNPDEPNYPSEFPLYCSWGLLISNVLLISTKRRTTISTWITIGKTKIGLFRSLTVPGLERTSSPMSSGASNGWRGFGGF